MCLGGRVKPLVKTVDTALDLCRARVRILRGNTGVRACVRAYVRTNVHTCVRTCVRTCASACLRAACLHGCVRE
ncbi:hypothetical protein EVAR_69730_1 [Eumeta japonica]|uniref:Uncharacterized protein n=1 Tax=Eumeta variegata TaxID=151549 RepID=A0A4C2A948_EUMVA|nr:hypothetical protein EVAR_69730_1 [Eumeta japonica]